MVESNIFTSPIARLTDLSCQASAAAISPATASWSQPKRLLSVFTRRTWLRVMTFKPQRLPTMPRCTSAEFWNIHLSDSERFSSKSAYMYASSRMWRPSFGTLSASMRVMIFSKSALVMHLRFPVAVSEVCASRSVVPVVNNTFFEGTPRPQRSKMFSSAAFRSCSRSLLIIELRLSYDSSTVSMFGM